MKRGMTLLETLLGITILVLVAAIAIPSLSGWLDRLAVDRARYHAATAHRLARMKAIVNQSVTVLYLTPDSLRIRRLEGRDTVEFWSRPGALADGVILAGPTRPVTFGPAGVGRGVGNGTWRFDRGGITKSLVVSRLGRLRMPP